MPLGLGVGPSFSESHGKCVGTQAYLEVLPERKILGDDCWVSSHHRVLFSLENVIFLSIQSVIFLLFHIVGFSKTLCCFVSVFLTLKEKRSLQDQCLRISREGSYCRFCCSADRNPLLVAEAEEVMHVHSSLFCVMCLPPSFHLMRAMEEEIHPLPTKRKIDFFKQRNPEAHYDSSHDSFFFLNTEFAFWGTEVFIYPLLSVIFFFLAVPGLKPCGMLAPQPGINLASLPLQGRFLTTEPSGKSHLLLSLPIKGTEEEEGLGDAWSLYWLTRFSEPRKENRKRWNVSVLWASVITSITKYRSVSCQLYNDHFSCLECGTVR